MILSQILNKKSNSNSLKQDLKKERPIRSVVKTISWRILGTIDTMIIAYIITGSLSNAFTIGSIEIITKMILYFFHERIWNQIKWGKQN